MPRRPGARSRAIRAARRTRAQTEFTSGTRIGTGHRVNDRTISFAAVHGRPHSANMYAAEASAIRPRVIDVHTVQRGETVQSLAGRMAYRNFQLERFLSLNGLASNASLAPGQKVKLVVYGTRRR